MQDQHPHTTHHHKQTTTTTTHTPKEGIHHHRNRLKKKVQQTQLGATHAPTSGRRNHMTRQQQQLCPHTIQPKTHSKSTKITMATPQAITHHTRPQILTTHTTSKALAVKCTPQKGSKGHTRPLPSTGIQTLPSFPRLSCACAVRIMSISIFFLVRMRGI